MSRKKPPRDINRKNESTKKHLLSSAKQMLSQFDDNHALLLIRVLYACDDSDKNMTMQDFGEMVTETLPDAYRAHFEHLEAEFLKGEYSCRR